MRDRVKPLLVLVALAVTLTACGEPRVSDSNDAASSADEYVGTWRLTFGRGPAGEVPLVRGWPITLEISGAQVRGYAACNSYGGPATITRSSFEASRLAVTEMGCATQVMRSEAAYLAALEDVDSISRREDS